MIVGCCLTTELTLAAVSDTTPPRDMSFTETLAKLREVSGGEHTLHFKALELIAGDLGAYAKDRGIAQARKFIHENKQVYFEPPDESEEMIYGQVERRRGDKVR